MKLLSIFTVLGWLLSVSVLAQDTQSPPAPDQTQDSAELPPVSDDVFIPSEEVEADEELVFPVDI